MQYHEQGQAWEHENQITRVQKLDVVARFESGKCCQMSRHFDLLTMKILGNLLFGFRPRIEEV